MPARVLFDMDGLADFEASENGVSITWEDDDAQGAKFPSVRTLQPLP